MDIIIVKLLVMIPMLILYLLKKMKRKSFFSRFLLGLKKATLKLRFATILLSVSLSYGTDTSLTRQINYKILYNNEVIGTININRISSNRSTTYSLVSEIKAKFIKKFKILGKETSVFKDGVLIYSSVFRKVNNKIKANHVVVYENKQYRLEHSNNGKSLGLNTIERNLVTLYFNEPKGENKVFNDNLKKMVNVVQIGKGKYKVGFSKGKYNVFHYENEKCVKIQAFSPLFNVTLIPV